jgi:hypothetical protein
MTDLSEKYKTIKWRPRWSIQYPDKWGIIVTRTPSYVSVVHRPDRCCLSQHDNGVCCPEAYRYPPGNPSTDSGHSSCRWCPTEPPRPDTALCLTYAESQVSSPLPSSWAPRLLRPGCDTRTPPARLPVSSVCNRHNQLRSNVIVSACTHVSLLSV